MHVLNRYFKCLFELFFQRSASASTRVKWTWNVSHSFNTVYSAISGLYIQATLDKFSTLYLTSNCNKSLNDGNDFQVSGNVHKYLSIQKCRVKSWQLDHPIRYTDHRAFCDAVYSNFVASPLSFSLFHSTTEEYKNAPRTTSFNSFPALICLHAALQGNCTRWKGTFLFSH